MVLDRDFDDRVRLALEPNQHAVDRIVSMALVRGKAVGRHRRRSWRVAVAAAAVFVCALCVARQRAPVPRVAAIDAVVVTRAGDVVMIEAASGTFIFGPTTASDRPSGTGFVMFQGDPK